MAAVSEFTERELIARLQQRLAPPPDWLLVGIGDDAAVVEPERNRVEALTVDMLIDGVHFDRRFTPAEAIGHRALAANLSDLAAMGASPRAALLSLALPPDLPCDTFDGIVGGLATLAAAHRVHVVGGNLTRTPGPLVVDVAVTGSVKRRRALMRRGARAGDLLYVTGSIGAAAAGLAMLRAGAVPGHEPGADCIRRYLYPQPRVRAGLLLGRNGAATACMDLSDGLADAVRQVAEASGVGVVIDAAALPIGLEARQWFQTRHLDPVRAAVEGGDDYELLFSVRPRFRGRLRAVARHGGTSLTPIGVCTADGEMVLRRDENGVGWDDPLPRGYRHFR